MAERQMTHFLGDDCPPDGHAAELGGRDGPVVITAAWLETQEACRDQVAIFRAEWGESAAITRANLERAVTLNLDLLWLAKRLLTAAALAEYERVTAPVLIDALLKVEEVPV